MSVGANSINRVSKQKIDATEKVASATSPKKKAKTSAAKTSAVKTSTTKTATVKAQQVQKKETYVENKVYCLTEELPYYLL